MKAATIASLAIAASLVPALARPALAESALVGALVSKLGVSEAQATGGAQALLGAVKGRLSPTDYASLLQGSPELGELAKGMAEGAAADAAAKAMGSAGSVAGLAPAAASGLTGEATAAVGKAAGELATTAGQTAGEAAGSAAQAVGSASAMAGGLDLSSLSKLPGLSGQFESLGLDAGMVQKYVPVVLEHFGGDSATAGLLKKGLGLL
ncbi:MAG TPA: DUF2780 domain-containing protein [Thermoanaerobaculia bacterium]|nr:DUF2780 domain-containing protein [Thermoanaerobaculia bacterium]